MSVHTIPQRMSFQLDRIQQGLDSGQLNNREGARLLRSEVRLGANIVKDAFDDGGLTARERAVNQARQDVLSARIFVQKHDGQTAE